MFVFGKCSVPTHGVYVGLDGAPGCVVGEHDVFCIMHVYLTIFSARPRFGFSLVASSQGQARCDCWFGGFLRVMSDRED